MSMREGRPAGVVPETAGTAGVSRHRPAVLHRWPSALGLAIAAVQLATDADREDVAVVLCGATLCYLGAAALSRPWIAWAGIVVSVAVVDLSDLVDVVWWASLGVIALVLLAVGLLSRVPRPTLTAQTAALIGYGGLAVAALYVAPRAGLGLAGAALCGHAVWDAIHYRRNQVVPRSLAEFCMLLDVPLGVGAIVLAIVD